MPLDTTKQQKWLPLGLNPQSCLQDTATGIPFPVYTAEHRFRYLQPPFKALLSSYDQHLNGLRCDAAFPEEEALKSSRKRFLVFDQSGNQTRLLHCGFPSSIDAEQGRILDSLNQEKVFSKDRVNGEEEESEMHEDTEEINALLYSDDDDCESDDDDDDDEVMSTGHSPFKQACNKTTREQVLDETESSEDDDGPQRRKRQKLLDHSYNKDPSPSPSLVGTITKLKGHDSNVSSSKQQETGSGLSDEQSRKDKIHTALRILESVVPGGAKGKEALLLLDEAIDYLKLLKRNLNCNHW